MLIFGSHVNKNKNHGRNRICLALWFSKTLASHIDIGDESFRIKQVTSDYR